VGLHSFLHHFITMSQRVRKHLPTLKVLASSTPAVRKEILKAADDDLIKLLVECCHNTLYGGLKRSPAHIKKLKKYKTTIRKIAKPSTNLKKKKKELMQVGSGFLPVMLPSIISGLASILTNIY
jgi:hypothetical protein